MSYTFSRRDFMKYTVLAAAAVAVSDRLLQQPESALLREAGRHPELWRLRQLLGYWQQR